MSQLQKPHKVSFYVNDDEKADIDAIKRHYGITSTAAAMRRALAEHAKQCKAEGVRTEQRVTYSRRVH